MSECQVLMFPVPQAETEPSKAETLNGVWMSLRYLEEECVRMGETDLAFLIGMTVIEARDRSLAVASVEAAE